MNDLTKSQKRAVRELLGDAHEAEIASALVKVEQAIKEWRSGAILPSDVSERIHEFHKESQEIYKTYNYLDLMFALARAVAFGFVELARVPEDLQPRIRELEAFVKGEDG
jgi:hypothetical protein